MLATREDITIQQGADLQYVVGLTDANGDARTDLTGATARMKARLQGGDPAVLFSITPTVSAVASQIVVNISAVTTAGYAWVAGVYDLELVLASGVVERVLQGNIYVDPEVTR